MVGVTLSVNVNFLFKVFLKIDDSVIFTFKTEGLPIINKLDM